MSTAAAITAQRGDHVAAAHLLGAVAPLRRELGSPLPADWSAHVDAATAAARAALGDAVFRSTFDEAGALPLSVAVEMATS